MSLWVYVCGWLLIVACVQGRMPPGRLKNVVVPPVGRQAGPTSPTRPIEVKSPQSKAAQERKATLEKPAVNNSVFRNISFFQKILFCFCFRRKRLLNHWRVMHLQQFYVVNSIKLKIC